MIILVDANVWLRTSQPDHQQYEEANRATDSLQDGGHVLAVVPQVLYEFWVVATRPGAANGLGYSASRAGADIDDILRVGALYADDSRILPWWNFLVRHHKVLGKKAHDARFVAAMFRHGISHLLTFNAQDFVRFSEVVVIKPADAASFPPATE